MPEAKIFYRSSINSLSGEKDIEAAKTRTTHENDMKRMEDEGDEKNIFFLYFPRRISK